MLKYPFNAFNNFFKFIYENKEANNRIRTCDF